MSLNHCFFNRDMIAQTVVPGFKNYLRINYSPLEVLENISEGLVNTDEHWRVQSISKKAWI